MTARDIARDLAVLKVVAERVRDARAAAEREARGVMEAGDRMAVKVGDELLAQVTLVNGRRTARVEDEAALLAWVAEHHPSEVQTVRSVRPAFLTALLERARVAGEPVDPQTGEVIPGVSVGAGEPYPQVRLTADADALVAVEWQAGRLPAPLLSALGVEAAQEGGDGERALGG